LICAWYHQGQRPTDNRDDDVEGSAFYQNSLAKFLDFLGPKADAPISEVTKAEIIAFANRLLTQVSAEKAIMTSLR
jgi:hypothetical protein